MAKLLNLKPNGELSVRLGAKGLWRTIVIVGGPFAAKPDGYFGICVREEHSADEVKNMQLWLPIKDFSVPTPNMLPKVQAAVTKVILLAAEGKPVYVGCMGGWGRTGLFLALVAKALGIRNPIAFVRKVYTPHAVETMNQVAYVSAFEPEPLGFNLTKAAFKMLLKR